MVLDNKKDAGFEFMKRISGFKWNYNAILSNMGYGALILGSIGFAEMLIRQILINKFSFSGLLYGLFLHGLIGSLIGLLSGVIFLYSFSFISAIFSMYLTIVILVTLNIYYNFIPSAFSKKGILLNTVIVISGIAIFIVINRILKKYNRKIKFKLNIVASYIILITMICGFLSFSFLLKQKANLNLISAKNNSEIKPQLVLIILVDSLRYDHLSFNNYYRKTSPNLDQFFKNAIVFNNAFSISNWTVPSVASLFTATYPDTHKVIDIETSLDPRFDTMAEIFRKLNYKTAAFMGNIIFSPKAGAIQGFDFFYPFVHPFSPRYYGDCNKTFIEAMASRFIGGRYYDSKRLNIKLINWLEQNKSDNLFAYIHYMDCHSLYGHPFYIKKRFLEFNDEKPSYLQDSEEQGFITLYDGKLFFLDEKIGELFNELREINLYDNSIIIVTADHGEELNDHDNWGHTRTLYDESIHIPLAIKFPIHSGIKARQIDSIVGSIDILPTLLDYVGIQDHKYMQGFSLLPIINNISKDVRSGIICTNSNQGVKCYREKNYKIIKENSNYMVFDIRNDPLEKIDIKNKNPELFSVLKTKLEENSKIIKNDEFRGERIKLDWSLKEKLRTLGYIK